MNLQHPSMPHPNSHSGSMRHPGPPHPVTHHKGGGPAMAANQHPSHTQNSPSPRNIRHSAPSGMPPHTPTMPMASNGMPSTPNSIMAPHTPNSMPGNHGMSASGPMGGGGGGGGNAMGSRPPMSNSNMTGAPPMNNSGSSMTSGPPSMGSAGPPINSGMPSGPPMTSGGNMGSGGPPMSNSSVMPSGPPMSNPNQGGLAVSTSRAPQVNSNSNSGGPASVGTPHSQTNPCTPQSNSQPSQGQRSGTPNTPMPNTPRGGAPPPPPPQPPQTNMTPAPPNNQSNTTSNNELNFDPAAVIDGAADSQDALESLVSNMKLQVCVVICNGAWLVLSTYDMSVRLTNDSVLDWWCCKQWCLVGAMCCCVGEVSVLGCTMCFCGVILKALYPIVCFYPAVKTWC